MPTLLTPFTENAWRPVSIENTYRQTVVANDDEIFMVSNPDNNLMRKDACASARFVDGRQAPWLFASSGCHMATAVALVVHYRTEKCGLNVLGIMRVASDLIVDTLAFNIAAVDMDGAVYSAGKCGLA